MASGDLYRRDVEGETEGKRPWILIRRRASPTLFGSLSGFLLDEALGFSRHRF